MAVALVVSAPPVFAQGTGDFAANQLLVMPSPNCSEARVNEILSHHGCTVLSRMQLGTARCYVVSTTENLDSLTSDFCECGDIQAVQKNYKCTTTQFVSFCRPRHFRPNDPAFPTQYELRKVRARGGWMHGAKGQGKTICILDTGVNPVQEMQGKLLTGFNAYNNIVYGTNEPGNVDTDPGQGHGTLTATAAAAVTNNAIGGASPARDSTVYPVIITDPQGFGYTGTIMLGLVKANENGAKISSCSFQFTPPMTDEAAHPVLHEFLRQYYAQGGLFFSGAGNDGSVDNNPRRNYINPVSATDKEDAIASFSVTGTAISFAAPGVNCQSTNKNGQLSTNSGTSLSSPIAAGVAAQIWSKFPTWTNQQVLDRMARTARRDICGYTPTKYGNGIPNARKATRYLPRWYDLDNDNGEGDDDD